MEAKLKKTNGKYSLWISTDILANTLNPDGFQYKLSLKNCQAIERGYDLDELADEYCTHEPKNAKELRDVNIVKLGFRDGFQKALEILGDKKFSASKLRVGMIQLLYLEKEKDEFSEVFKERQYVFIDNYIQSLQQTEWEVEVEMDMILVGQCDCPCHSDGSTIMHFMACCHPKMVESPKLDADGCIVLKRKQINNNLN